MRNMAALLVFITYGPAFVVEPAFADRLKRALRRRRRRFRASLHDLPQLTG